MAFVTALSIFSRLRTIPSSFISLRFTTVVNRRRRMGDVPAKTAQSDALSKDLLKRGFKFVGSTICYAYMQAVGMADDHSPQCFRR